MYRESRIAMDTVCTITVVSSSGEQAKEAIEAGFSGIKKLEQLLNYFSPGSEITVINKASGSSPVKVSRETLEVIQKAAGIADYTNGAFDPTIGPVMKLWGFNKQASGFSVPSAYEISTALKLVDYRKIKINSADSEVFLEERGMELDLGGIAKGYAADRVIEIIKKRGIKAALVSIAGDIRGIGLKPDGNPWEVGIQSPRPGSGVRGQGSGVGNEEDIFASIFLKDKAISTSGDYQRFFMEDGKRYHHIIDPRTGYPSAGAISVSVMAPEGFMADGLSTGIFVLGRDKGMELLKSMGLDGIIVDGSMGVFVTDNLKGKIRPAGNERGHITF